MAKQISVIPKIAFGVIGQDYKGYWVGSVEGANKIGDPCVTAIDGVGLSSDPRVLPITIAENPRTLINSYDYGGVGGLGQPGSALYGIYDPTKTTDWDLITKAQSNQKDPEPSVQNWSLSNPYGAVTVGNTLYLIANDSDPTNKKCSVYAFDMSDGYKQIGAVYTFDPAMEGDTTEWNSGGYGLEAYSS